MNNISAEGRLTADPEPFETKTGKIVANFTLANDTGYGDYKKTNWFRCKAWGKTGEYILNYGKKVFSVSSYPGLLILKVTRTRMV